MEEFEKFEEKVNSDDLFGKKSIGKFRQRNKILLSGKFEFSCSSFLIADLNAKPNN